MNDTSTIITIIQALAKKSADAKLPEDAVKYAQAALNLAHTASIVSHTTVPATKD